MLIRKYTLSLLLSLLLLNTAAAFATDSPPMVGTAVSVHGKADATNTSGIRTLEDNSDIFKGDSIRTAAEAQVQLVMQDGGKVALGGDTVFSIDEYGFDPDAGAGRILLNLVEGAFRAASGKLNELSNSNFSVVTPRGTIGVRGTEFWGGFLKLEGHTKFGVLMLGGKGVEVTTPHGTAVLDKPGQGVWIDGEGKLVKQDIWSKEMIDKAAAITGEMPN